MPAVTADTFTLPRLARPAPDARFRPVKRVAGSLRTFEGEGFPVRRPFPNHGLDQVDPFVLFDHMGAVDYGPGEAKGTPWHPHRGFETVTYIIDGAFEHEDSTGGGGLITNGATQWMTAGAGILHIEKPPESLVASGGLFHGVQLWVNLPSADKFVSPKYQDIHSADLALVSNHDGSALVRVIAGEIGGFNGPGMTHTPIAYLHASVPPGSEVEIELPEGYNTFAYALSGGGFAGLEDAVVNEGELALFGPGSAIKLRGGESQPSNGTGSWEVLILGGQPISEPVARYGPFVMNTKDEIRQALEDFQSGRMGNIPVRSTE